MKPLSHQEYLEAVPAKQRELLIRLLDKIRQHAPEAIPVISYGMPAFRLGGRILVYAAAYKGHIGFYPADSALLAKWAARLEGYPVSKGTVQLPLDGNWPDDILDHLICERVIRVQS